MHLGKLFKFSNIILIAHSNIRNHVRKNDIFSIIRPSLKIVSIFTHEEKQKNAFKVVVFNFFEVPMQS